ncbi:hypothetical protein [Bartonella sp. B30(2025)]
MQEWIIDKATFLLHWINDNSVVASIVITIATGMAALIVRSKDRRTTAKIREEDRKWVTKQFTENQRQTVALENFAKYSEKHIGILLKDKNTRDLESLLHLEADFDLLEMRKGIADIAIRLHITNLAAQNITIRNIQITEKSPFAFCEIAIPFAKYIVDTLGTIVVINRTTPKPLLYIQKIYNLILRKNFPQIYLLYLLENTLSSIS